tara:strand:- start:161 stop:496 length:336 start_codon:yes stop_codon:yes gene_type:complete
VNESNTETINMVPDHVHNMRLGVMLAARGVTNEGLEGILKESEKVGRLADAMCALLGSLAEHQGKANTCESLLANSADDVHVAGPDWDPCRRSEALRDGLRAAAAVLDNTD